MSELIYEPTVEVKAATTLLDAARNPRATADQDVGADGERIIEAAGRECYDSYGRGRSSVAYHAHILEVDNGSVLQHVSYTFRISGVSRGLTHELVRHKIGIAVSQRSTRYVAERDTPWVVHPTMDTADIGALLAAKRNAREAYIRMVEQMKPRVGRKQALGAARAVLGNALATSLYWTANVQALRHCLDKRAVPEADAEICRLFVEIWRKVMPLCPAYFADYRVAVDEATGWEYLRRGEE